MRTRDEVSNTPSYSEQSRNRAESLTFFLVEGRIVFRCVSVRARNVEDVGLRAALGFVPVKREGEHTRSDASSSHGQVHYPIT